jgi:LPS export ABC transporter protein LptC
MNKLSYLILPLALLLAFGCSPEKRETALQPEELPDQILENSIVIFTVNGIKSTVVKAKYIEKYFDQDLTKAKGLYVDFFDQDGNHTSVLVADSGDIQEKRQILEVKGKVVVTTDKGVKLQTRSLRWDPNLAKIITDDFVKITRGEDVVTGYGLESDPELKHIKIKKDVSGEVENITREEIP